MLRRDTLRAEREAVRSVYVAPQHRLYFLPDPQGHAWLRPILGATEIGRFKLRSPTVFMIGYRRAKRAR